MKSLPEKTEEYSTMENVHMSENVVLVDNVRTPKSIRVNIFGTAVKVCSFNCGYCEYGPTEVRLNQVKNIEGLPESEDLVSTISKTLAAENEAGRNIERIVVSCSGEPTLHPRFQEFTQRLVEFRDNIVPSCKLGIMINGTYLDQRKIFNIVAKYDEKYCKIDAGSEKYLKKVNSPLVRISTERILEGFRRLEGVIVSTMFIGGELANNTDENIADWMEMIGIIQPQRVVLSTLRRAPSAERIEALTDDDLQVIGAKLRMKLGMTASSSFD